MREMRKYRDYLIGILADPEEAIAYLQTSQEEFQKDGDTVAFLLALQSIAQAQVGNNELLSQVYLLSGDVHHSRGEYDWAIEDYDTVIELTNTAIETNPNDVEAYIYRGLAYHHKSEYDRAIKDLTKVIQLDPNNTGDALASHPKEDITELIRLLLTRSKERLATPSQAMPKQ